MANGTGHDIISPRQRRIVMLIALIGAVVFVVALTQQPERAWRNLLLHNFYFTALSLMGAIFIAIHYLARAGWHTVIRRVPEAMTAYLPLGGLLMVAFMIGGISLYPWAQPEVVAHDEILQAKAGYLNTGAVLMRTLVYFACWIFFARSLVKRSKEQDETGDVALTARNARTSGVFAVVFAITFTFATIDWLMSLEPHWYSTLFPWYVTSSVFVSALAMIALLVIVMRKRGHFPDLNEHHLHDLGKFVFAFSVFWGYLWFSQYMLIWYANIPEETTHYAIRTGGWWALFVINPIINLGLPFILLPAANKKRENLLMVVLLIVIAGHWLDIYLLVMPSFLAAGPSIGWVEIGIGAGIASLFLLSFDRAIRGASLIPKGDPYLQESLHHHG